MGCTLLATYQQYAVLVFGKGAGYLVWAKAPASVFLVATHPGVHHQPPRRKEEQHIKYRERRDTAMLALLLVVAVGAAPLVTLDCGAVLVGTTLQTNFGKPVSAFRGVPYALPPTGTRRWLPPVTLSCPAPAGTLLNVSVRAAACWQNDLNTGGRLNISQSEDCLTIDIFVQPSVLAAQRPVPVIAWIYGGSLVHGSTNSYAGLESLAARGEIILVAMNYRLAAFGWLSLPELDGLPGQSNGVSSNRGLLDIQESLRWVQRNVHSFGGDPGPVCLLGRWIPT